MTQHRQHHYHRHRHRHRMEIVLENPSVPLSARTPVSSATASTTTTSQMGLPLRPPLHAPHRTVYDVGASSLLPEEDYYARNHHGLISYGSPDGALAPVTVRRIDKSGLLEIAEAGPMVSSRPCVLAGAEDISARTMSLRVDRSGLLEAVPEAVDQPEEHCSVSIELEAMPTSTFVTVATTTTKMSDEGEAVRRGETLQAVADISPCVFPNSPTRYDGNCPLERPSSLEGQACSDDISMRCHPAEMKLTGSSRIQLDVSKATEKLPHLSFSPGPSRSRLRNNSLTNIAARTSPLINRCTDIDSTMRLQNQKSPEFAAKYLANTSLMNITNSSQGLTSSLDYHPSAVSFSASIAHTIATATSTMTSPIMRGRLQVERSRDNPDATMTDASVDSAIDTSKVKYHEFAKESTEQENDSPGEERAEAEGCEHTTVENLEEDKVSFKGSNKLLDNDNVQTLRVIILSEQL